ncbi:hypothetical protein G9A89_004934 [Geosiphon pyriformis]|nr:hypothetical protein G9A89_004934 [Geosiphon pyriformis]
MQLITHTWIYLKISPLIRPRFMNLRHYPKSLNVSYASAEIVKTKDKTEVIVFAGDIQRSIFTLINSLKISSPGLEIVIISREIQRARTEIDTVIDEKGKIYFWGGIRNNVYMNKKMYIYDTNSTSWTQITPLNCPLPRFSYTATLLPDGRIIYIGGSSGSYPDPEADLSAILIFNINGKPEDPWSYESAKSVVALGSRRGHTAILAADEYNIIIYGGHDNFTRPAYPLMVLDTKTFTWSVPIVESLPNNLSVLSYHTATRYQNLMIIAFGAHNLTDQVYNPSKEIRIFDISNGTFKWLQNYVAPLMLTKITKAPTPSTEINVTQTATATAVLKNSKNSGLIIGVSIGSIILIFLGLAIIVILYRRRLTKTNNNEGSTTNNQLIQNPGFHIQGNTTNNQVIENP